MKYTNNLNLKKPEQTEFYNVDDFNENADKLDEAINGLNTRVTPIENGGTGATTVASARNALGLGNTSGALPIENGGTGATTASDACVNLGITPYLIPTGTTLSYSGNTVPDGFLLCDGSAISRTTYAKLFAVIGTTYGAGDGSTTFNLPDLTDRFVEGSSTAGNKIEAGLPNIVGSTNPNTTRTNNADVDNSGALNMTSIRWIDNYAGDPHYSLYGGILTFDASRSNPIYGESTTVQPPALTMRYIIKY